MCYYFSKIVSDSFDEAMVKVTDGLKGEGFRILSETDLKKRLKKKYDVDFRRYVIIGVLTSKFPSKGHPAGKGTRHALPCDVIVQEISAGKVKVTAIDPLASVYVVENPKMENVAAEIRGKLKTVIDGI